MKGATWGLSVQKGHLYSSFRDFNCSWFLFCILNVLNVIYCVICQYVVLPELQLSLQYWSFQSFHVICWKRWDWSWSGVGATCYQFHSIIESLGSDWLRSNSPLWQWERKYARACKFSRSNRSREMVGYSLIRPANELIFTPNLLAVSFSDN